jgi:uncharacterized protein YndB with AHSA1/START domain
MSKRAIERSIWIDAPRERVWKAVTDPAEIAQWFAPGSTFSRQGNSIYLRVEDVDVEVAIIAVFDPPRRLTTRELPDGVVTTTYLLEEEGGGTRFTVIEEGLEAVTGEEVRRQRLERDGAGWERLLDLLRAHVASLSAS